MERTVRERIRFIKNTVEKHKLSTKDILAVCDKNGGYVHEKTLAKILKDGSEDFKFHYQTIIGVYEALYAAFGDEDIPDDVATLKRMIAERNRQIDNLLMQIEKMQEHFKTEMDLCEDRKKTYEKTIAVLEEQLAQISSRFDKVLAAYLSLNGGGEEHG